MKKTRLFNLVLLLVAVLFVQDSRGQDTLEGHTNLVWSVVFSSDGTKLVSGSGDNTVKLWDMVTHENIATLEGHTNWVESVVFSSDGTLLASGSVDGTILLWNLSPYITPSTPTPAPTPDFDGDGMVGFPDFLRFAAQFGLSQGDPGYDARYDLDGDGAIGFGDFLIFANAFGKDA